MSKFPWSWCVGAGIAIILLTGSISRAVDEQIFRYKENKRVRIQGQEHVVLLVEAPRGGHPGRLVVPNGDDGKPKADTLNAVNGLSPGTLIEVTARTDKGISTIESVSQYSPKPGEETPNGYVFVESKPAKEGSPDLVVVLSKLGEKTNAALSVEKSGSDAPQSALAEQVQRLKPGDAVWADLAPGKTPMLLAILPWEEPKTGKLLKVSPTQIDGKTGYQVEIDDSGKQLAALIPGKLQKDKWVTDARLLATARRLRAGSEIRYRVQEDGSKLWLREIAPPPKPETAQNNHRDNGNVTDKHGVPTPRRTGGPVQLPPIGITPGGF